MLSFLRRRRLFLLQVLLLLRVFLLHLLCLLLMFLLRLLLPCIIGILLSQPLMLLILLLLQFLMFLILLVSHLLLLLLIFLIRLRIPGAGRLSWLVRWKFASVAGAARRTWHIVFWTRCCRVARRVIWRPCLFGWHDRAIVQCARSRSSSDWRLALVHRSP